jgi:hypothetical protein
LNGTRTTLFIVREPQGIGRASFVKDAGASQIGYLGEKPAKSLYQLEDSHDFGFTGFAGLVNFLTISYLQFGDIFHVQHRGLTGQHFGK